MQVYLGCSIRNVFTPMKAAYTQQIEIIARFVGSMGHACYTPMLLQDKLSDDEIFKRDLALIDKCDCMIAECSFPSLGVGYEIGYAQWCEPMPILVFAHETTELSAMVIGNKHLTIARYHRVEEQINHTQEFLLKRAKELDALDK